MLKRFIILFVINIVFVFNHSYASEYSQPDFYNVTHFTLNNGLRVILKPRLLARNVSIRLNVGVGHNHFSCGKHETAHFLEHLLFTGTSKHSENELDDLIESHGGSWNAATSTVDTTYKVDIYNKNINVGLSILHEVITDSLISEDNIEKSRKIINRESGGKPSFVRNWLHKKGIVTSSTLLAVKDLLPNHRSLCDEIDQSTSITKEEITSTLKNYYIPQNMTLSIVGFFDIPTVKKLINDTLGLLPKGDASKMYILSSPSVNNNLDSSKVYTGSFSPLLGTDALVYQIYRIPNLNHKDRYVFDVLEDYLYREMFKLLRVENGLAYSPSANSGMYDNYGLFLLSSDSEIDDVDANLELINQVIEKIKNGDLDEKVLKETKLKILLSAARGYETNEDFSEYYVGYFSEIEKYGHLRNFEDGVEKVTLADIQRVSKKYFHAGNRVIAVSSPTMTYTQFYIVVVVMIVLLSILVWRIVLGIRKKKHSKVEYL